MCTVFTSNTRHNSIITPNLLVFSPVLPPPPPPLCLVVSLPCSVYILSMRVACKLNHRTNDTHTHSTHTRSSTSAPDSRLDSDSPCVPIPPTMMPRSELPINPPTTNDQMPALWWQPKCCDRSLLVGTYKHGCENYRPIRNDPVLCFFGHLGPDADPAPPTGNTM